MAPIEVVVGGVPVKLMLTRHAVERMRERGITVEGIVEALSMPCDNAYDRERDVYLTLGCNRVAVVYAFRGSTVEVVTVLREPEYRFLVNHVGARRYRRLG